MYPFCIDAAIIGTEKHLVCSDDGFSWHTRPPNGTFHLTGATKYVNDDCLDSLLRLANTHIDLLPPKKFVTSTTIVAPDLEHPPWQKLMPAGAHRAFVRGLVDPLVVAMAKAPTGYFRGTWGPGNTVIRSLQRARIDAGRLQELIAENAGNVAALKTFAPDEKTGFAPAPTYDRFGTLTGRLTVTDGPSILTLKREHRSIIVPSTPAGCIMYVDFAALEARVLLYEAGKRCDDPDVYGSIAKELGYDRKAVKGAVISELYGSSRQALGAMLGISGRELGTFVKRVRAYFSTDELLGRIKSQFIATGSITNRYGRPVVVDEPQDNVLLNYFAQSTGADVALLGFSAVVDGLSASAPGVRPLFLLHDGMFLDVPGDQVEAVEAWRSVKVPGYVQSWPLKVEKLT